MIYLLILTFVSGVLGTSIGGILGSLKHIKSGRKQSYVLAASSGLTISIVFCDMIRDAFLPENAEESTAVYIVIPLIAAGFFAVYLLNIFIKEKMGHHHNHDVGCECGHDHHIHKGTNLMSAGIIMTCAIGLHNLPAGLVIGASYAQHPVFEYSSPAVALALAIFIHNIPEGMTITLPLVTSGMKKAKAVMISAFAGVTIMIGGAAGYLLGTINPLWMSVALSFASGAMMYVVFGELIPEVYSLNKSKKTTIFLMSGILLGTLICNI